MLIELTQEDAKKIATFMAHSMIGGEAIEVQKMLNEIARLTQLLIKPFEEAKDASKSDKD